MSRFLKRFGGFLTVVFECVVGVMLLIDYKGFSEMTIIIVGVVLAAMSFFEIISYFRMTPEEAAQGVVLTRGLVGLVTGFFMVFQPQWFTKTGDLLLTVYGVGMMALGLWKLATTVDMLRLQLEGWPWRLLTGAVTAGCAIVTFLKPFSDDGTWVFVGIGLVVMGVTDAVAMIMIAKSQKKEEEEEDQPENGGGNELTLTLVPPDGNSTDIIHK